MQSKQLVAHRHGIAGLLAALLLIVGGMIALVNPVANAAHNSNIQVTVTTNPLVLLRYDTATQTWSEVPGQAALIESPVRMGFEWDASNADPQPGDSFFISLPAEYRFREANRSDDLVIGDGTVVGECVTSSFMLTCTFNDAVTAANDVMGSITQVLMAQRATTTNNTNFDLNGTGTTIYHPNSQPIQSVRWTEKNLSKYANSLRRDSTAVTWHIQFSGTTIATHLGDLPDGSVQKVTFTDAAGDGQVFNTDLSSWYVRVNPEAYGGGPEGFFNVARANGAVLTTAHGTFTLSVEISEDGKNATMTLERTDGTFDGQTNYEIVYQTLSEGGPVVPSKQYRNDAQLVGGKNTRISAQITYRDPITYDIIPTEGFGAFGVKKYITGANRGQVTSDTTVRVNVSYVLPNGLTEADFPSWTTRPPSNPYTVEIAAGTQQTSDLYMFPRGTVITLTEDVSAAALPIGLGWGSAVFSANGTESPDTATFTVANLTVTPVGLYNEVTEQSGSFSVTKTVAGDNEEVFAGETFRFTYTCGSISGTQDVPGNGTTVTVPVAIPVGTECTVAEEAGSAAREGYSVDTLVVNETFTVVAGDGSDTVVSARNTYTRNAVPEPTPEPSESPTPTPEPSDTPTPEPSESPEPTPDPSESPEPSPEPSDTPTPEPSESPAPTSEPSTEPTSDPSEAPGPTPDPTDAPAPTSEPSAEPGPDSSASPTAQPASPPPSSAGTASPRPARGGSLAKTGASTALVAVGLGSLGAGLLLRARRRAQ